MGKIFDALAKSKKENGNTVQAPQNPSVVIVPDQVKSDGVKPDQVKKDEAPGDASVGTSFDGEKRLYDPDKLDKNLVTLLRPQSFEAEQFKMLRTNILFPASGKPPRSILVTSAVPGEGKSFVAANLAVSIAQNIDEYVLLMDCDMRLPSIHTIFGFDEVAGLSEYLSNGTPLSSLFLKTHINKLSILPGGKPPYNPSELLSSESMSQLLEELKSRYSDRYLIIDSPPPRLAAETRAIARQVDGIVLVIKSGSTSRKMIADVVDMVGKEKIIGTILNCFDLKSSSYYGYGKYGSNGKYYSKGPKN